MLSWRGHGKLHLSYLYHHSMCRSLYVVTLLVVIGTYQVRISAGIPIILTEGFYGFPRSLQANFETLPEIRLLASCRLFKSLSNSSPIYRPNLNYP
jgi:hypothetical protein